VPVVIVGQPLISGVMNWAFRLHALLQDHPQYRFILLQVWKNEKGLQQPFQIHAPNKSAFMEIMTELSPAIVIVNWAFKLIPWCMQLNSQGANIRVLGMCHSDSADEYYDPLQNHEQAISHFIAVSPEIAETLTNRMPHRENDITQLVYGVPIDPNLSRSYQTSPIRLLYAGRIVQLQKRVMDFVPLVEALTQMEVDFRFHIAGDGAARDELKQALRPYIRQRRVRFLGKIPPEKMSKIWQQHDVFLQVSDFEGTSVSMLEAMSNGVVPILTDSSSGVRHVIKAGRNGFVAPVGDMQRIAMFIRELLINPEWLPAMGYEAYATAQNYSLQTYGQKFVTILDNIMNDPVRGLVGGTIRIQEPANREEDNPDQEEKVFDGFTTVFSLPEGLRYQPTTLWVQGVQYGLEAVGYHSTTIAHQATHPQYEMDVDDWDIIRCPGNPTPYYAEKDVENVYSAIYGRMLPAVFIPNYGEATYATCAVLAQKYAEQMRVIGMLHAEEYHLLKYYEPIIHKFVTHDSVRAERLKLTIPHRQEDIEILPYGIHVPASLDRDYMPNVLRLVHFGEPVIDNDVDILCSVAKGLAAAQVDFRLDVYGDISHRSRSKIESLALEMNHYGTFNRPYMWQNYDLLLVLTHHSITPITLLEAMAAGCVPLATFSSGIDLFVEPSQTGILLEAYTGIEDALLQRLIKLKPNVLEEVGQRAYQSVKANHNHINHLDQFINILNVCWQMPSRPWPATQSAYFATMENEHAH